MIFCLRVKLYVNLQNWIEYNVPFAIFFVICLLFYLLPLKSNTQLKPQADIFEKIKMYNADKENVFSLLLKAV